MAEEQKNPHHAASRLQDSKQIHVGSLGDPTSDLEIFAKEVLNALIMDNLPPSPNNFALYFDRILEDKSDSLRHQIGSILELEESNEDEQNLELEKTLKHESKFNNELLYQMSAMCFEKLFVALLAYHGRNATHHTPYALVREVETFIPIPQNVSDTAKFIGSFESICSLSGFGYKMPDNNELHKIITGLVDCHAFVEKNLTH